MNKWRIRLLGNYTQAGNVTSLRFLVDAIEAAEEQKDAPTILNAIVAVSKIPSSSTVNRAVKIAQLAALYPDDETIQHVAFNMIRRVSTEQPELEGLIKHYASQENFGKFAVQWVPRLLDWSQDLQAVSTKHVPDLCAAFLNASEDSTDLHQSVLQWMHKTVVSGNSEMSSQLLKVCGDRIKSLTKSEDESTTMLASLLLASWGDEEAIKKVEAIALTVDIDSEIRISALKTIAKSKPTRLIQVIPKLLENRLIPEAELADVVDALGDIQTRGRRKMARHELCQARAQPSREDH